jgi:putative membrane protein
LLFAGCYFFCRVFLGVIILSATIPANRERGLLANRQLLLLIGWYVAFWAAMAISPLDRSDWLLENLLVFVGVAFLASSYHRLPLSNLSYLLITIFMTLHAIGAHYTYEQVPLGYWLRDLFGQNRNHFDRLVHFSCGLLLTYPVREALLRVTKTTTFWAYFLPLAIILSVSGFFELLESWVARIVSPKLGIAYLGTQGDIWDAQKDMNAALVGSLISLFAIAVMSKFAKGKKAGKSS